MNQHKPIPAARELKFRVSLISSILGEWKSFWKNLIRESSMGFGAWSRWPRIDLREFEDVGIEGSRRCGKALFGEHAPARSFRAIWKRGRRQSALMARGRDGRARTLTDLHDYAALRTPR